MSRIYFIIAGLIVLAGVAASFFAPTDNMGMEEAFYAHLLLLAPPLFIGTVISALAVIIQRLDQLLGNNVQTFKSQPAVPQERNEDFSSLFAEKLRSEHTADQEPLTFEDDALPVFEEPEVVPAPVMPNPQPAAEDWRAPTVDEYLEKGAESEEASSSQLAREGTFAGRSYRMYEDGSLEIDTDQSTIRFDSLEEFRSFVSSAKD